MLLGYATNKLVYRVFNTTTNCVEVAIGMTFDESDDSQMEQVNASIVDNEEPLHVKQPRS